METAPAAGKPARFAPRAATVVILLLSFALTLTALQGCKPREENSTPVSFYYWRTVFAPSGAETALVEEMKAGRLYVRFFDLDRPSPEAPPAVVSPVAFETAIPAAMEVVPCVFVTVRAVKNTRAEEVEQLAGLIRQRVAALSAGVKYSEIQLDCDWTPSTRERFFALAEALRRQPGAGGLKISSTLRLHQLKFPKEAGVPPVDSVSLMLYNMGDVDDPGAYNTILDLKSAVRYLDGASPYPLPMTVVLPLFGWGVVHRRGQVARLINDLTAGELVDAAKYAPEEGGRVRVLESHYLRGIYLYKGDLVRVESVEEQDLAALARMARPLFRERRGGVSFFSLSPESAKRFGHEKLDRIVDTLR